MFLVVLVTSNAEYEWGSRFFFQTAGTMMQTMVVAVDELAANTGNSIMSSLQPFLEPATETVGRIVAPHYESALY